MVLGEKTRNFIMVSLCAGVVFNTSLSVYLHKASKPYVSKRKPVVILDIEPAYERVPLGGHYLATFIFSKTRDDCTNGHVVRHMWEVETGANYKTEDRPATVHEPVLKARFTDYLSTTPMNDRDAHKMHPGIWSIKNSITYDCPAPSGAIEVKRTDFATPPFELFDPEQEDGQEDAL